MCIRDSIQMVQMRVRDDHRVEVAIDGSGRQRTAADEDTHAQAQERIGEYAHAVYFEEHGGVPDEGHRERCERHACVHTLTISRLAAPRSPARHPGQRSPGWRAGLRGAASRDIVSVWM